MSNEGMSEFPALVLPCSYKYTFTGLRSCTPHRACTNQYILCKIWCVKECRNYNLARVLSTHTHPLAPTLQSLNHFNNGPSIKDFNISHHFPILASTYLPVPAKYLPYMYHCTVVHCTLYSIYVQL